MANIRPIHTESKAGPRSMLLRICQALHRFGRLDDLLGHVTRLIRMGMRVDGAAVILLDAAAQEFYFAMASHRDAEAERRLISIRFPAWQGAAGQVRSTGEALVVEDYGGSPYALKLIDARCRHEIRNMLVVALRTQDRFIGVLWVVNKHAGRFDARDIELLGAIADIVALPIDNTRLQAAVQEAREQVLQLRLDKDRVIHHLSHELKTPLAVLSASIALLARGSSCSADPRWRRIHARIERNLQRLLDMEYKLEDILRDENGYPTSR